MKNNISIGQYLRLNQGLKLEELQRMIKNQNLLKLVTGEEITPWEYISATCFGEENAPYGQYLSNINYLGYDKHSIYFMDVDGYLIKSNYSVDGVGLTSTMILTSTSVHPLEDAADLLKFNFSNNITKLIKKSLSTNKALAVCQ